MATKKSPAKKSSSTRVARSKKAAASSPTFMTVRFTHESIYWIILGALVLALGLWVLYLTDRVQRIYDQVDASQQAQQQMAEPSAADKKKN